MNYQKLYIFDFCGTIINKKTHLMIKWYCLLNGHFSFFIKYFTRKKGIDFDIKYISKYVNIKKLALFIFKWSNETNLFLINKSFFKHNHSSYVLTAAMDELVNEILILYGINISNDQLIGSNRNKIINGNVKKLIIEKLKKENPYKQVVFFTDSWDDQPVFDVVDKVVFSELLDRKCKLLIKIDSKYSLIK